MKKNNLLLTLFAFIFFISCENNRNESVINGNSEKNENPNFISKEKAIQFANELVFYDETSDEFVNKKVSEIKEIDGQENPSLYVMNYKDNGFVIIAADNRSFPIFAVSKSSNFPLNAKTYPTGLVDWTVEAKNYINEIRIRNLKQDAHTKYLWEHPDAHENILMTISESKNQSNSNVAHREPPIDPDDPYNCGGSSEIVNPLIQTKWGQGFSYNSQTPYLGCTNPYNNGYALTGCVATSMAQIMKFHNYPNNYNWSSMSNNYGTSETARLMRDIGNSVGMDYGCDASSANTENSVANAFKNNFGYSQSATYIDYEGTSNYNIVRNELRISKPVILKGGRRTGTWPFYQYVDGHAWVCDGFVSWSDCHSSMLSFYMNWGWEGSYNGLFALNNFNPSNYSFNYKSGAIVGIRKP